VRIAFRSPNWLGDTVLSTVVPPALRRAHPDATIHVLAPESVADVWRHSPFLDEAVSFPRGGEVDAYRRGRYDLVLLAPESFGSAWRAFRGGRLGRRFGIAGPLRRWLLAGSLPARESRRDRHQVENYRALAGLLGKPEATDVPRVVLEASWRDAAVRLWHDQLRPRVVLQPGATYGPAKRWSAERFAQVARALCDEGNTVAVIGGPDDRVAVQRVVEGAPALNLGGRTGVGVLGAVLEAADVVITNDTGPMHLAAAVGTPTVAIFGSTNPVWTSPFGAGHRIVREPVPCSPCYRRDCKIGYLCLERIPAERVLAAAREVLQERKGAGA
jgi:heptosyltransferase-2